MDDPGRREYCKWDLKLIKAFYINKAFEIDGHPIHIEESKDIAWVAETRTLRSAAAVDALQDRLSQSKAKNHGVRVVAVPKLREGATWPTRAAWRAGMTQRSVDASAGDQKLKNVGAQQEARAAAKLAAMREAETPVG